MLTELSYRSAVAAAIRAPSVHNTQPWLFHRSGNLITLRADRSRSLPLEDPTGRELHLSCGGALRHLLLGLRANQLDGTCELLPQADDPDLLAVVTVYDSDRMTLPESNLFAAVWTRHTDRSVFHDPTAVSASLLSHLQAVAEADGCHLDVLDDDGALLLATLGARAEHVLETDEGLATEQQRWTSELPLPREGVPVTRDAPRGSDVPLRRFGGGFSGVADDPPAPEHPTLCVLSTDSDAPTSWLRAGWALSDLLLTLESEDLAASPLTQVLEQPALRAQLTGGLGLQGHPQVVLRIGAPVSRRGPETSRRPVADVLR